MIADSRDQERCGDWPPDGADFTDDLGFRPEAYLVAERAGQSVGRMQSILNELLLSDSKGAESSRRGQNHLW
jgi:hypothetical protein